MAYATSHLQFSSTNINIPLNPFSIYYYCSKKRNIHRPRKIIASRGESGGHHDHRKNHGGAGSGGGAGGGGSVVDENMFVLRERIHEMKIVEGSYEAPSHWSEWEKKYYNVYDTLVCQLVGLLQAQMMKSRPSLVLGFTALILLSFPTCSALVLFHFLGMAEGVLEGGTLG